jgi:hypothetical protein
LPSVGGREFGQARGLIWNPTPMINRGTDRIVNVLGRGIVALLPPFMGVVSFFVCLAAAMACASAAGPPREIEPLRVAVYDVPPYGYVDTDGSISGVSVDLWRRVSEQMVVQAHSDVRHGNDS